jgi:small subunit ribosomal protein S17
MAKKKDETVEETNADAVTEEAVDEQAETAEAAENTENTEDTSLVEDVIETVAETAQNVAEAVTETAADVVGAVIGTDSAAADGEKTSGKRAEKIGIVFSDKMTKTVVVRVDRMVKHPLYHKYMKRRKKFMAHDELGATEGDKVRIVETRPLSARKRWRVVEIIQKAEK